MPDPDPGLTITPPRPREESHAGSRLDGSVSTRAVPAIEVEPEALTEKQEQAILEGLDGMSAVQAFSMPDDPDDEEEEAPPAEEPLLGLQPVVLPFQNKETKRLRLPRSDPAAPPSRDERNEFLTLVTEGFSITKASKEMGVARHLFQSLLDEDPAFKDAYRAAFEASADILEDEAWRRSQERGRWRLGSDRLLELSLKARRPWRYAAQSVQVTGKDGGPIKARVEHVDYAAVLDVLSEAGLIQPGEQQKAIEA